MIEDLKNKRITVILGGLSKEREISLRTGGAIFNALSGAGYKVNKFDPMTDDVRDLSKATTDVAFIALHGRYGEDGCIQGFLEMLKIPYTGSGVLSSAICFDKIRTKIILQNAGVLMPESWTFREHDNVDALVSEISDRLPLITKPSREGSTIGMVIVHKKEELKNAILESAQFCSEVLIEEFITGTEVTVGVLNGKALPAVEIAPKSGFYDYKSKYTVGMTEYFVPARIDKDLEKKVAKVSEEIVNILDCQGSPRVDFIIDKGGKPFCLEVNTIPGMTETSLLPKAAKGVGMDFLSLCEAILSAAKLGEA